MYLIGFLLASKVVASELPGAQPKTRNRLLVHKHKTLATYNCTLPGKEDKMKSVRTYKNLLPPVVHHHLGNTQICQKWNHSRIGHTTVEIHNSIVNNKTRPR